MQYYIIVFIAVVLLSLQFATNKAYGLRRGNSVKASLIFTTFCGAASAAVSLIIAIVTGEGVKITPYSAALAALIAVFCCTYTFIGFKIMALGSLSVFTMFLMLGGMLLPYIFGVLKLNEDISFCRILGVILLTASLVFPVLAREKSGKSNVLFILLCLGVFLLNGGVSIVSKIHQITTAYDTSGSASFSFMCNLMNAAISGTGLLIYTILHKNTSVKPEGDVKIKCGRGVIALIITANAVCNGVSYMLQLVSAGKLPASVMYPMMTGGSVVLTALAGLIFFREKPDKISLAGIILAFAATFLFLF